MKPVDIKKHIGRSLQKARINAGFKSAAAFAEHMGMTTGTYTAYEQGKRMFDFETAWNMADALNCSLDELGGREWQDEQQPSIDERQRLIDHAFSTLNDAGKSQALIMINTIATSSLYSGRSNITGNSSTTSRTA